MMKRIWVLFALLAFISFGCQKAATKPEAVQPAPEKEEKESVQKPPEKVTEQKIASGKESVESQEKAAGAMEEKEGIFKDIHFDFDKYDIKNEDKSALKAIASWMTKNPGAKLSVEGHCDDRGTNEYNLALGDRRAKAVKDYLLSLGVSSSKIETVSYGEEKPLCTEETEDCWAKNRRAHFVVLGKVSK
ncbi:MAG TPA: peptidoglycan-associated lipoprotein Pal [Candidatus Sulfobium mesophilum]|jgi:peptidoglycan-associated lipoprotein|nr:peptidoglycan-associated lipoprotein Pal [Candidatus Sulfobium mesophilum]